MTDAYFEQGTIIYMACAMLQDPKIVGPENQITQDYQHDLESLFWIAYYDLVFRRSNNEEITQASQMLYDPNKLDPYYIRLQKLGLMLAGSTGSLYWEYRTIWAKQTCGLVEKLCCFWLSYYQKTDKGGDDLSEELTSVYKEFIEEHKNGSG